MRAITRLADYRRPGSFASRSRQRRSRLFEALVTTLPPPRRVLDVGGTPEFWLHENLARRLDLDVVVLNLFPQFSDAPNITCVTGDAANMAEFSGGQFDIAFSNSVIEHLGTIEHQKQMAREVVRVGRKYFVQTPNRWFPLEPHFLVPGFQLMPVRLRIALLRRFRLGWYDRTPNRRQAEAIVREVRLMSSGELRGLFPGARLWPERLAGLTKSYVVIGGWEEAAIRRATASK